MHSRWANAAVWTVAAILVVALSQYPTQRPAELMMGNGLDAVTIGMDQNAMLASNPKANSAFLKVFGNYIPGSQQATLKGAPQGSTQLAMTSHKVHRSHASTSAEARLNAKMATSMQNSLTAGSTSDSLMSPHFLAALSQAEGYQAKSTMLSQQSQQKAATERATMDALAMTAKGAPHAHLLPSDLRAKYAYTRTTQQLHATHIISPAQAAMRAAPQSGVQSLAFADSAPNPTGGNPSLAGQADASLLAAQGQHISTKELIREAAMRQMNSPAAPAPVKAQAKVQQLTQVPAGRYYQQPPAYQAYQQPVYAVQPYQAVQPYRQAAPYQQAYQYAPQAPVYQQAPVYAYAPPAQTQMAYQTSQPAQQAPAYGYGYAPPQQPAFFPQAPAAQQLAQPAAPTQQLTQQQLVQQAATGDESVGIQTPEEIGQAAANAAAGADWRAPDASLKKAAIKGAVTAAKKAKMKDQMMALREQIDSDYKKNTKGMNDALLMGPGSL